MRDSRIGESLTNRVAKLFRLLARVHNRAIKPFDVSALHAHVLTLLWLEGPMNMGELQSELGLSSSTLTGAIDRMERNGLVRRVAVKGDRRAVRIEPMTWPDDKREKFIETLENVEKQCFAGLSAAERRQLATLLSKAIGCVETVEGDAGDD